MEGELHRLEREVIDLRRSIGRLIEILVAQNANQQAILSKLDQVIELLEPSTDYPASTGGTITVK